jgi:hypothetical protein
MNGIVKEEFTADNELDFEASMKVIAEVEKGAHKGDFNFLKNKLGHGTFKKMATLGFIRGGFYILNGKIVDTYAVTQSYKEWNRILNRKTKLKKLFSRVSL